MKKILLITFFIFISTDFVFSNNNYKICDNEINFENNYNGPTIDKNVLKLEEDIFQIAKKIFLDKKLDCQNIKSELKIIKGDYSKNKKDIIFGISYISKMGKYKNHYFLNENKISTLDYKGYSSAFISRYGKHNLFYLNDIKSDIVNQNDFGCKNNAGYYLNGKRIFCLETTSYYPSKFLKDKNIVNFFSKNIYGQEKFEDFNLSEKTISKIEQMGKTHKIQSKKYKIYKIIEDFNKKYESKKINKISKKDYINYELLNYLYGYMKLMDLK